MAADSAQTERVAYPSDGLDEIAGLRAYMVAKGTGDVLASLDDEIGPDAVNGQLAEFLIRTFQGILDGSIIVAPMNELQVMELENHVVTAIELLGREPRLSRVRVAEMLVRYQGAVLRSMRRGQRRAGASRAADARQVDVPVQEFDRRRREDVSDQVTARRVLSEHDPAWSTYNDVEKLKAIGALTRRARRKRGHS